MHLSNETLLTLELKLALLIQRIGSSNLNLVQSHLIVLDSDWYQMLHTEAHPVVFWAPAPPPDIAPVNPPKLLIVHQNDYYWDPPWESRHFNLYDRSTDGPTFQKHVLAFLRRD